MIALVWLKWNANEVYVNILLRLNWKSFLSHICLLKKNLILQFLKNTSVLRLPRHQSLWSKSQYEASQILLIRFFQNPNDQCCATGFCWGVSQLPTVFAEIAPLYMLKVRDPPQRPPLIISNGTEVDFQTVGSLSQQGSGSPWLLTHTCRETHPHTLIPVGFIVYVNDCG